MTVSLSKKVPWLLLICMLTLCGLSGCSNNSIYSINSTAEDDAAEHAARDAARAAEAEVAAVTNGKVMALLFPESPPTNTDLNTPNITTTELGEALKVGNTPELGEALKTGSTTATVVGNLAYGNDEIHLTGIYGFNVNLGSGSISNGAMSSNDGYMFNVHSGTGSVNGNDFNVGHFQGSVASTYEPGSGTNLTGTASAGFGAVGDIGASGTFTVTDNISNNSVESGNITDGKRIQ
jgi:hypothetical protein